MERVGSIHLDYLSEDDSLSNDLLHPNPFDEFAAFDLPAAKAEADDGTDLVWGDTVGEDYDKENEVPFVNVHYSAEDPKRGQLPPLKQRRLENAPKAEFGVGVHDTLNFESRNDQFLGGSSPYAFRVALPPLPPLENVEFGAVDAKTFPEKSVFVHSRKHRIPSIRVGYEGVHFEEKQVEGINAAFGVKTRTEGSPVWSSSNTSHSSDSF